MSWISFELDPVLGAAHYLFKYSYLDLQAFFVAERLALDFIFVLERLTCFFQKLWISDCYKIIPMNENRHIGFRVP